jgi:hypothetical protein
VKDRRDIYPVVAAGRRQSSRAIRFFQRNGEVSGRSNGAPIRIKIHEAKQRGKLGPSSPRQSRKFYSIPVITRLRIDIIKNANALIALHIYPHCLLLNPGECQEGLNSRRSKLHTEGVHMRIGNRKSHTGIPISSLQPAAYSSTSRDVVCFYSVN